MNFLQSLRRLGQQAKGWSKRSELLEHQFKLITKLYEKNGLTIKLTCSACPEQYDVFNGNEQVGYLRLRYGYFTVEHPDVMGELIFEAEPNGDGDFDQNERLVYLTEAMRAILKKINK